MDFLHFNDYEKNESLINNLKNDNNYLKQVINNLVDKYDTLEYRYNEQLNINNNVRHTHQKLLLDYMESENENYDLKKENYILEILNNKLKKKINKQD